MPESMRERSEILEHTHLMGIRSLQPAVAVLLQQKMQKTVAHMQYISTQAKDDPHYYIHNEVGYNLSHDKFYRQRLVWRRWRNCLSL